MSFCEAARRRPQPSHAPFTVCMSWLRPSLPFRLLLFRDRTWNLELAFRHLAVN
jgi:hypothetical protein